MRKWRLAHCEINVDRCVFGCEAPRIQLRDSAQKDDIIMAFLESSVNALIQPAQPAAAVVERDPGFVERVIILTYESYIHNSSYR